MAMKFVIRPYKNVTGKTQFSWKLFKNDELLGGHNGFDTEKSCREAVNKIKKVTRFTKVEVISESDN